MSALCRVTGSCGGAVRPEPARSGTVIRQRAARRREFLERSIPAGIPIHAILDSQSTRRHERTRARLARHPRRPFHSPRRRLGHGVFRSAGELRQAESVRCLVGAVLEKGIIVDATIISAPSSTKNRSNARDPEMHRTRKGNRRHFGMKLHIGTDPPLEGTVASVAT